MARSAAQRPGGAPPYRRVARRVSAARHDGGAGRRGHAPGVHGHGRAQRAGLQPRRPLLHLPGARGRRLVAVLVAAVPGSRGLGSGTGRAAGGGRSAGGWGPRPTCASTGPARPAEGGRLVTRRRRRSWLVPLLLALIGLAVQFARWPADWADAVYLGVTLPLWSRITSALVAVVPGSLTAALALLLLVAFV